MNVKIEDLYRYVPSVGEKAIAVEVTSLIEDDQVRVKCIDKRSIKKLGNKEFPVYIDELLEF